MDTRAYVTVSETRQALRKVYRADTEANITIAFMRAFEDDLTPVSPKGDWRPSSLLIIFGVILISTIAVFAYFSLGGSK